MNIGILINEGPYTHEATDSAYLFARAAIEKELAARHPQQWQALLDATLTGYRQNPEGFLWLVGHFERLGAGEPKGIVTRILDLLESAGYKPYWSKFRAVLIDADYRLVQSALAQMNEGEAGRLLGRVGRARILDGYIADEIEMGVEVVFKGGFNRFQIHLHRCQDFPLEIDHATSPIRSYSMASLIRACAKHPMATGTACDAVLTYVTPSTSGA